MCHITKTYLQTQGPTVPNSTVQLSQIIMGEYTSSYKLYQVGTVKCQCLTSHVSSQPILPKTCHSHTSRSNINLWILLESMPMRNDKHGTIPLGPSLRQGHSIVAQAVKRLLFEYMLPFMHNQQLWCFFFFLKWTSRQIFYCTSTWTTKEGKQKLLLKGRDSQQQGGGHAVRFKVNL